MARHRAERENLARVRRGVRSDRGSTAYLASQAWLRVYVHGRPPREWARRYPTYDYNRPVRDALTVGRVQRDAS